MSSCTYFPSSTILVFGTPFGKLRITPTIGSQLEDMQQFFPLPALICLLIGHTALLGTNSPPFIEVQQFPSLSIYLLYYWLYYVGSRPPATLVHYSVTDMLTNSKKCNNFHRNPSIHLIISY